MDINEALDILRIVKCDNLGHCRDLRKNPTPNEIGHAIEVVEAHIYELHSALRNALGNQ